MQTPISPVIIPRFPGTITGNRLFVEDCFAKDESGAVFNWRIENVTNVNGKESVTVGRVGNVRFTQAQWDAWGSGVSDTEYILGCVALNLGLTRA